MAKRKMLFHLDHAREKIQAGHLIDRLQDHIDGKLTLSNSQVRAIGILLKKVVPDLAQIQIAGEVQHKYVVEVPALLTKDEWQKKYGVTRQEPPPTLELEPVPTPHLITSNAKQ
jgi:hypothetical protein